MIKRIRSLTASFCFMWALTLALSPAQPIGAQAVFDHTGPASYEYHVQHFQYDWDETLTTAEFYYTIVFRPTGDTSPDGEPLIDVSVGQRLRLPESEVAQLFSFGMLAFLQIVSAFGGPWEYAVLSQALTEMDLEIGERLSLFGTGRVSVVEEQTVAGRRGLLLRFETGEGSERRVAAEWIIDTSLPFPLATRQYDEEGRLILQTVLTKYEGI